MTKQAELKKQAYASDLKSRALSVLIYLIDRSNKDLTCFPAIPTMAKQLHISVSTVKRALKELTDKGYIKKEVRFRERNHGQSSNLYTLFFVEKAPVPNNDNAFYNTDENKIDPDFEAERYEHKTDVPHITFETLKSETQKQITEYEAKYLFDLSITLAKKK